MTGHPSLAVVPLTAAEVAAAGLDAIGGLTEVVAAARDPLEVLAVVEGDTLAAIALGHITPHGYRLEHLHGDATPATAAALLDFLAVELAGNDLASALPAALDGGLAELLRARGFGDPAVEVTHHRGLDGRSGAPDDPLTYLPIAELGRAGVIDLIAGAGGAAAGALLDELVADALDTTLWRIAALGEEPVGLVLAHRELRAPWRGTLGFVGTFPAARGRGFAHRLVGHALAALAAAGADELHVSARADDAAALRLLAAAGCAPGVARHHRRRAAPPAPAHLPDLAALRALLAQRGHRIADLDEHWLALPVRCGPHRAALELGWAADPRLLHVVSRLPLTVPDRGWSALARDVCAATAALDVGGYQLDEARGELAFRLTLPLDDAGLPTGLLDRAVRIVVRTAATHAPTLTRRLDAPTGTAGLSLLDTVEAR